MSEMPSQRPFQPSLRLYRRIATIFLALAVAIVGFTAYAVFSRATVIVLSRPEDVEIDLVVDAAREYPREGDLAGDVLELSDSLTQQFPAASLASVNAHAEGLVRISSTLARPQTLVATTRLLAADGALFRIKETVVVPANGSVDAEAFADAEGAAGDIGQAVFSIPGLNPELRKRFSVETARPFFGGVKEARLVTKSDVASAAEVMKDKLAKELIAKLRQAAAEQGLAAPKPGGEIISVETVKQSVDNAAGAEAENFSVTLELKATGVYYDEARLSELVAARLAQIAPHDRRPLGIESESVKKTVEKIDFAAGRATLRAAAAGTTVLSADNPALDPEKLVGVTADSARLYLEKVKGVASASVSISPFWFGRMPAAKERIKVIVR